ncbi:Urease accessory protein UreD [compost metagenome]
MQPLLAEMQTLGQMEGFTHQATLIHINTGMSDVSPIVENTHSFLQSVHDIDFGVSQPFATCIVVRVLGNGGEQLYNAFRHIQQQLWTNAEITERISEETVIDEKVMVHAE